MVLFEPGPGLGPGDGLGYGGVGVGVGSPLGRTLSPQQQQQHRDQGLYHGGSILKEEDCIEGRRACYERFLHSLRQLRTASAASIGGGAVGHAQVTQHTLSSYSTSFSSFLYLSLVSFLSFPFSLSCMHTT